MAEQIFINNVKVEWQNMMWKLTVRKYFYLTWYIVVQAIVILDGEIVLKCKHFRWEGQFELPLNSIKQL